MKKVLKATAAKLPRVHFRIPEKHEMLPAMAFTPLLMAIKAAVLDALFTYASARDMNCKEKEEKMKITVSKNNSSFKFAFMPERTMDPVELAKALTKNGYNVLLEEAEEAEGKPK